MFNLKAPAVRQSRRTHVTAVSWALASMLAVSQAAAQAPAPNPAPAGPATPRSTTPAPQRPAVAPVAPARQAPTPRAQQGKLPQLTYSPWTKFCNKAPDPAVKQVCFTGRDARNDSGVLVVAVVLIEPDGEPKKNFRVTLPSPLQLQYGTRVLIDQSSPLTSPFFTCFANGCMADYEGTPDLITKLKSGQSMQVEAIDINGSQISISLPLVDFKRANEGAPSDAKKYEEDQKKLQDDLQKKADEQRKKI